MTTEKIIANESLADNELDLVTGGFAADTYEDMAYISSKCILEFGTYDYDGSVRLLAENFASAGIRFQAYDNSPNEYYNMKTGKMISRLEAMSTLLDFAKKNGRLRDKNI